MPTNTTLELLGMIVGHEAVAGMPKKDTLAVLRPMQVSDLVATYGLDEERAVRIMASIRLAENVAAMPTKLTGETLTGAPSIYLRYGPKLRELKFEQVWAILLNGKHRVIHEHLVSQGTLTSSPIHPREMFAEAVRRSAAAICIVHNHPSGTADPSADDLEITRRLCEVGNLLGIRIVDHVIIGDGCYTSLSDRGLLGV